MKYFGALILSSVCWISSPAASQTVDNPQGCKVVEKTDQLTGSATAGGITSSVTAGGGKVEGHTTGGNSVTVHSKDGRSVATAGSSGANSSATVTTSDGDCVIYVSPESKKGQQQ